MKYFIGIDPGKAGAIAIIDSDYEVVATTMMPIIGSELDIQGIKDFIFDNAAGKKVAAIEKVTAMAGWGGSSVFKFGYGAGLIHGVIGALDIPIHLIAPKIWQQFVLNGLSRGDKAMAIQFVARAYPNVSLLPTARSTKPSSGIADAICIARYASYNL